MDAIASAYAAEYLLEKRGLEGKAYRLGEYNKEVLFACKYFNLDLNMPLLQRVEDGEEVGLLDHNEFSQSVDNIENAKIKLVIDHHKIDNFKTKEPLVYIARPVGCNSTNLYEMLKEMGAIDRKDILAMLLSAIISDTLLLKSPTTTESDIKSAEEIAKILNVDINEYGLSLLKAGADLSDVSDEGLINIDSKLFEPNSLKIEIAQINAVDMDSILSRQIGIESAMNKAINDKGLDAFLVAVTDVINCNSEIIALGSRIDIIEKAFNVNLNNNRAFLEGVVSRKKQLAPPIMDAAN